MSLQNKSKRTFRQVEEMVVQYKNSEDKDIIQVINKILQKFLQMGSDVRLHHIACLLFEISSCQNPDFFKGNIDRMWLRFKGKDLDGVFTVNELFAVEASKALRTFGHKVPDDVSIVCFSDGDLSKYATPSLTTVSQHGEQMGSKAAELLINKLERPEEEEEEYKGKKILIAVFSRVLISF